MGLIPLERCDVPPGQIARKEVPNDVRDRILKFSTMKPPERITAVKAGFSVSLNGLLFLN
jgi:eukaryotic translation initiation factor 2C